MLPFSQDAFFALFEQYSRAIWPAQITAYLLGLAALAPALRPMAGGGRAIAAILAAAWAWNGIVYHFLFFATINFWADGFAVLFLVQALLLAWAGVVRGSLPFRFRPDLFGWTGLALVVFAMAGDPLVGTLLGRGWPRAPVFGVSPGPLTIFTMGLLLMAEGRTPPHLVFVPVLWSLIGGMAAWLLGVSEDLALPVAGVGGLCLIRWKNRRQTPSPALSGGG